MTTERPLSQYECDRAIAFMRRCASRGESPTWDYAVRYARYARDDSRDDDAYDDRDRPHRPRSKPLRLTDADADDDRDDMPPISRPEEEGVRRPRRPRQDDDDTGDDDDNRPARRRVALDDDDDGGDLRTRGGRDRRKRNIDALLARVAKGKCVNCGKQPAGSVWTKTPDQDEEQDLDGDPEDKPSGTYLVPMCLDCKRGDDADEVGETEVAKRHSRARGDCLKYSRSVRLFNEARDRRDR
jgi:hypothetical protein